MHIYLPIFLCWSKDFSLSVSWLMIDFVQIFSHMNHTHYVLYVSSLPCPLLILFISVSFAITNINLELIVGYTVGKNDL